MQKVSAMVAVGILVLQLIAPVGVAFAQGIDTDAGGTVQTQESSETEGTSSSVLPPIERTTASSYVEAPLVETSTTGDVQEVETPTTETDEVTQEESSEEGEDPDPEQTGDSSQAGTSTESTEEISETQEETLEVTPFNVSPQAELGNIFTFDYFKKGDLAVADGDEIDFDTDYSVQYKWEVADSVKAGDTATLPLPDVFKHWENTPEQDIVVDGIVVGKFTANNGQLVFTFNENIENQSVRNGFVGFSLAFDEEKFEENWKQEIDFDADGTKDLTVVVIPREVNTSLVKKGVTDAEINAKEITWTIDIINGSNEDTMTNGVLADVIPAGLGDPRDFIVTPFTYNTNGDKILGTAVDGYTATATEDGFEMVFDLIAPRSGYQVEYKTSIEDITIASFTNEATFEADNTKLDAASTVSGGERSNPIQKDGTYVPATNGSGDQIQWTITVNENGMSIDNAIIEDELPEGLSLVEGSIKVSLNGTETEMKPTDFPIELGEVNSDQVYKITYLTDIDWTKVNNGEYTKKVEFPNIAILFDGDEKLNEDDATVSWDRASILEKKGTGTVNYDTREITWEVTVNKAKHPLADITVTDQLPDGLELKEISFIGEDGEAFEEADYGVEDGLITIDLKAVRTETITIRYTTSITDFIVNEFKNAVGMNGEGVGTGGSEVITPVKPKGNTYTKSSTAINYEEKTINWQLNVDPVREDIEADFTITDTFPYDGLILLPDTVNVTLGGTELIKDTDYTLAPIGEGYQKGFTIVINKEIAGGKLVVNYSTSYDEQKVVDGNTLIPHSKEDQSNVYKNQVVYKGTTENGNSIEEKTSATRKVIDKAWNSGFKEGNLVNPDDWTNASDRKIAWQVYFNYNQHNLGEGVSVTDTLAYAGTIIDDSIKVSVYTVASNGDTTITEETLEKAVDYNVAIDGQKLTVEFLDEVTERYVIEFETTVPDISAENYVNNAELTTNDDGSYPYTSSVDYDKWDDLLDKEVLPDVSQVYIGEELEWKITANESLSVINNATLTDTISAGLSFVEDSFTIVTANGETLEEEDYTLDWKINDSGETVLSIEFTSLTQAIEISYKTIVVAENNQTVNNKVSLEGSELLDEVTKETSKITARQFSWVGGEFSQNRGALRINKVDASTGEVITESEATFALYRVVNDAEVLMGEFTTIDGVLEVGNLFLGTYIVKEVKAPDGYRLSTEEIQIEVDQAYGSEQKVFAETFKNISDAVINIPVQKVWDDADNQDGVRPESIKVALLANGEATEVDNLSLNAANNWQGEFNNLPELDVAGEAITYTIEEIGDDKYESSITGSVAAGFVITNSYTPAVVSIPVEKVWDDAQNQDGIRPEYVTVRLFADDEEVDFRNLSSLNDWQTVFSNLPKYQNGTLIEYKIKEDAVTGYTSTETSNSTGKVLTNTHIPEVISLSGTKTWDDVDNQDGKRPESIVVRLLANGKQVAEQEVEADSEGVWSYHFDNLAKFSKGEEINYTVTEDTVKDYLSDINGLDITNSYEPGKTEVSVVKRWEDNHNQDGIRPESVVVRLLANGEETDYTKVLNEGNNWQAQFTDLDEYQNGQLITYKVIEDLEEDSVYEAVVEGSHKTGFTITNSYTPETINISGVKTWDDADNQDGKRPESIKVRLLANGINVKTLEVTEEMNWTYEFTELPKFEKGSLISYTLQEANVEEYSTKIDGFDITNTHTPGKTSVDVTKVWNDNHNQDGIRPEYITVKLLADGEDTGQTLILNDTNNWQGQFTDLDEYQAGELIAYTVEEVNVPTGYETVVTGSAEDGYVLNNNHTPEQIDLSGTKIWDDADNQDGKRPESIKVRLLANGKQVAEQEVTANEDGTWTYTFEGFDKYKVGEEINYTVTEDTVKDYTTVIDGFAITNSYTPGKTSVNVVKTWDDNFNQDGLREESVKVRLVANGEPQENIIVLNAGNNWQGQFTDLDEYQAGELIDYTVEEIDVPTGYEAVIEGTSTTGYVITNAHTPEQIDLSGTKTWDDADNQDGKRPESIVVRLLADGKSIDTKEVSEETDWSYQFEGLPKFKDQGTEIDYKVIEEQVPGYQVGYKVDGTVTDIYNTYTPGQVSVDVLKVWKDGDDIDGKRPDAITVRLLADGEVVDEQQLTADNGWRYIFTDLAEYQEGKVGQLVNYTVEEVPVDGYQSTVTGSQKDGFVITNNYTPKEPTDKEPTDKKPTKKPTSGGTSQQHGKLPQTGENVGTMMTVLGLVILMTGFGFLVFNRKQKQ